MIYPKQFLIYEQDRTAYHKAIHLPGVKKPTRAGFAWFSVADLSWVVDHSIPLSNLSPEWRVVSSSTRDHQGTSASASPMVNQRTSASASPWSHGTFKHKFGGLEGSRHMHTWISIYDQIPFNWAINKKNLPISLMSMSTAPSFMVFPFFPTREWESWIRECNGFFRNKKHKKRLRRKNPQKNLTTYESI